MTRNEQATYQRASSRIEALEHQLDQHMTRLEESFRQHMAQHNEKEKEIEKENVEATPP